MNPRRNRLTFEAPCKALWTNSVGHAARLMVSTVGNERIWTVRQLGEKNRDGPVGILIVSFVGVRFPDAERV